MDKQTLKSKLFPVLKWVMWVLLVQFILINISAALYAYKFTHLYNSSTVQTASGNVFTKTWHLFSGPKQVKLPVSNYPSFPFDTVKLKTSGDIGIDTWYSATDSASKGTVILFHGIQSNKSLLLPEASAFRWMGYNVLLVDFRAHGNSEGRVTTLGVRETEEVAIAYDYIRNKGEKNIFLYGSSMGAVTVLKAVDDYELKPAGLILEMPFASLQSHLRARARVVGFQGFPEKPFGFLVSCWMGWEKGFNGLRHRTTRYAAKVNCPVLFQYGGKDPFVLKAETDKVFAAIAAADKTLVGYPEAGHESLQQHDAARWEKEVQQFLGRLSR
ncbi:MAG: alpha/beta hydrolase [Chitinophagaceae bacterium]|nr:alpha/beta hydrolase [Chitinophagaceae bacterium]